MRAAPSGEDSRELLREVSTLLLAAGAAVWVLREGGDLGSFAALCILGIPAAVFLRAGLAPLTRGRGPSPSQAVSVVVGLSLAILALREFVEWVGSPGDASHGINVFWTFGAVAGLAAFVGLRRGIRFGLLFAGIAATVSFSGLVQAVLSDGIEAHYGIYRALLLAWSILLAACATGLARGAGRRGVAAGVESATSPGGNPSLWQASELLTASGLSAVLAGGLGILSSVEVFRLELGLESARSSVGWELILLLAAIALIVVGARLGVRGPTWVGALGLALFIVVVGYDIAGNPSDRGVFGVWPWVLLVLGAIGLVAAAVPESSRPVGLVRRRLDPRRRKQADGAPQAADKPSQGEVGGDAG